MVKRMFCIDDTPGHGRRTWAVRVDKLHPVAAGFRVQHVGDIALAVERDVLRLVFRDGLVTHLAEQCVQLFRLRVSEFDEFKAVGTGGVLRRDLRGRGIVRKRSHSVLLENKPIDKKNACLGAQGVCNPRKFA